MWNILKKIGAFLGPWLVVAIVVAIVIMGIGALKTCNKPIKGNEAADYFKKPGFKTDTITIHDTIRIFPPAPPSIQLPPKVVYIYEPGKFLPPIHDTTYRDTGKGYEEKTRGYDRLVYGEINKDTVRLDLFSPQDSSMQSKVYPVDFLRYRYVILNNQLRISDAYKIPSEKQVFKFFTYNGTYIMETHDFLKQTDNIGLRTGINLWKIRVAGFGSIPIRGDNKKVGAGVAVGFRLF